MLEDINELRAMLLEVSKRANLTATARADLEEFMDTMSAKYDPVRITLGLDRALAEKLNNQCKPGEPLAAAMVRILGATFQC